MRHFWLIILIFFTTFSLFADNNTVNVEMSSQKANGNLHNEIVPEVTYDPNENTISVEFEALGSYTLIVRDVDGQVLHSVPVVTNGNSYSYDVNLLPENYYVITITSVDDGYIGVLETEAE
ncbi:MAG: hypothetical protein IKX31_12095 [Muribaculaceae bacterium]|nr:hypothetical protein [Muribaculaceae bacterium]